MGFRSDELLKASTLDAGFSTQRCERAHYRSPRGAHELHATISGQLIFYHFIIYSDGQTHGTDETEQQSIQHARATSADAGSHPLQGDTETVRREESPREIQARPAAASAKCKLHRRVQQDNRTHEQPATGTPLRCRYAATDEQTTASTAFVWTGALKLLYALDLYIDGSSRRWKA